MNDFDAFFRSYVATALWSSATEDDRPLDHDFSGDDLAPETRASMEADCRAFYDANAADIHCDGAPLSQEFEGRSAARRAAMAGHDFWLTRNRHGAGFWDGDWPEPHGARLDAAAKAFGELDLYIGDDGRIHA